MADFVAVLKKTIGGLSNNTPETRERVYQKARDTIAAKLSAMQPQPPKIVIDRQKKAMEDAIKAVESSFATNAEPDDEFDAIFAGSETKAEKAAKPAEVAPEPKMPAAADFVDEAASVVEDDDEPEVEAETGKTPEVTPAAAMGSNAGADSRKADEKLTPVAPAAKPEPVLPGAAAASAEARRPVVKSKRRMSGGLIAAAVAVVVVAAAGYGIWLNRDAFMSMISPSEEVALAPSGENADPQDNAANTAEQAGTEAPTGEAAAEEPAPAEESAVAAEEEKPKFTQRLTAEGGEVDAGPAGGETKIGEGTSVASATQQGNGESAETAAGEPAAPANNNAALPVGQRAIFYEERTTVADSTAEAGATVWSVVQESPGGDLPAEPAIRAEVTVPSKGIRMRMTIRRNADESLPASHIIEMIFLTADGFEGGGIDNVLRVAMKPTEAAAGNPLIGIPAKIADGYFLIALSNVPEEKELNLQLMRQQSWIDIPIVYKSGRRALVTMERGFPGDRAFVDAIATWNSVEAQANEPSGEQSSAAAENN